MCPWETLTATGGWIGCRNGLGEHQLHSFGPFRMTTEALIQLESRGFTRNTLPEPDAVEV